ncbi:hypothetical protein KJ632_03965, partial [Patescibacteria group bacterium]|nr:hypothetical protein [Patescibacteria group bacterium]
MSASIFHEKGTVLQVGEVVKVQKSDGTVVDVQNDAYENPYGMQFESGDKVMLYSQEGGAGYFIQDYWHLDGIVLWSIVFLVAVVGIFGKA